MAGQKFDQSDLGAKKVAQRSDLDDVMFIAPILAAEPVFEVPTCAHLLPNPLPTTSQ